MSKDTKTPEALKEAYNNYNEQAKAPSWCFIDSDNKRKVIYSKLVEEILEERPLLYAQSQQKTRFYQYEKELGYWKLSSEQWLAKYIADKLTSANLWTYSAQRDCLSLLKAKIPIRDAKDTLEAKKDNISIFANGVYDWEADTLKHHNPNYYFTYSRAYPLNIEQGKTLTSLEAEKWLEATFGSENLIPIMEFIGYCFLETYKPIQAFIIILGNGGEGKTTFLNFVENLIGKEIASHVSLEDLSKKGQGKNFSPSELYGKALNIGDDIAHTSIEDTSSIKKLTGGGIISANVKNAGNIDFANYAKLWFSANDLPSFRDSSNGMERRIFVFKVNRITNFEERFSIKRINEERPLFAYHCISLAKKALLAKKLTDTKETIEWRKNWLDDNDPVQQFLDECCEAETKSFTEKTLLRDAYEQWCKQNGYKPINSSNFKQELERKGFLQAAKRPNKKRIYYFTGLKLIQHPLEGDYYNS